MDIFETITVKDVKIQIAELVKVLRKQRGLNQEELAAELSLSRLTISKLEQGRNITLDTLLKVVLYFDLLDSFHGYISELIRAGSQRSLY